MRTATACGLRLGAALGFLTCASACADAAMSGEAIAPPSSAAPAATATAPAASPAPTTGAAVGRPGAQPSAAAAGSGAVAVAPATAPSPAVTPSAAPQPAAAVDSKPLYPDACAERRGSWSRPCTQNPDPCNLKSGYPGDEYCLLPPPKDKGVQIHFGPKSYTDMAEVAKYLIKPGEEFNSYGVVNVPTTEDHWFAYVKISMRPGSHHLINQVIAGHPTEGFLARGAGCEGQSLGSFIGTQNLILESPPQGIPAPENQGLGRKLPGNASICQNYHRYNTTEAPALSEIWYNVWFIEEKEITQKASGVMINAGPRTPVPAHTMQSLTASSMVSGDGRIISLFGHRHSHTERFAVWLNEGLIYDSWDWEESRLFNYDSITQNPAPAPEKRTDGAISGVVKVKKGDTIKIQCDVNNTSDQPLRFANELNTAEMCILFGASVGVGIN